MSKTITSNILQAISSKTFFISILCFTIVVFLSSIESIILSVRAEELLENGFHAVFLLNALESDAIILITPIAAALPYTTAFIDDMRSGYIKEYLPRTTFNGYIFGKSLACYLSGGAAIFLGVMFSYGLSILIFAPMEAPLPIGEISPKYFNEIIEKSLPFFFSGGLLSLFGLLFSTLTNNKYMAYSSPFIVYYILIILKERYIPSAYVIYPKEWLNPTENWIWENGSVILFLLMFTVVIFLCFYCIAQRRLERI